MLAGKGGGEGVEVQFHVCAIQTVQTAFVSKCFYSSMGHLEGGKSAS